MGGCISSLGGTGKAPVGGDMYVDLKNEWQLDEGEGGKGRETDSRQRKQPL